MRGVLAGFDQSGQERVFAAKAHQHQQVGAIEPRNEAGLHRHAVRVLDAGGQAEDLNVVTSNLARQVGQVGERGYDADFGGLSRRRRRTPIAAMAAADNRRNSFDFILSSFESFIWFNVSSC